ncbi:MAG: methylmalonyl-CoA mutase family protein [Planctomycetes bacterium]|nr:methylmalonyl-CoA mutase family protein [Planctomycetota bacterium]
MDDVKTSQTEVPTSEVPERNGKGSHSSSTPGDARSAWEREAAQARTRPGEFTTISGEPVDLLYDPSSVRELDYARDLGYPGEYPYTRGVHANMYRGRLWTMRQFAGFGTAAQTNERFKFLLGHGQTGLSVAFDFPTLMGYDGDHPRSLGEVGRVGVAISSLADMERLFEGIPMDQVSTSMTINGPAAIMLAFYIACADKQGVPRETLRGTVQNDILKEYQAQHAWLVPAEPALRIITDVMEFSAREVPKWNTISISGYHIREAGSTAEQELAFTLANGFEYVRRGIAAGMDVDTFAPRLSHFFDVHMDFFEEIAKLRAARRIWARHMKEEFCAKDPNSWKLRFHSQTAGVSLTEQQPENNIVRTAFEALAAVLGGTQSLHTNSMDETYALPTEKAVKIALRTQQIIADETEVANVIDPLAGSYYVEAMTSRLEEGAERYFAEIEKRGGVVPCTQNGWIQQEIHRSSLEYQRAVEQKRKAIVGVNKYVEDGKPEIELLKIDPAVEKRQVDRLAELRRTRDGEAVRRTLDAVRSACRDGSNLLARFVDAAHAYCTLGEIADVLREEFGEFEEPKIF